jgi:hypothetical protein
MLDFLGTKHSLKSGEIISNKNEASYMPFSVGSRAEAILDAKDQVSHNPPMISTQQNALRCWIAWKTWNSVGHAKKANRMNATGTEGQYFQTLLGSSRAGP